MAMDSCLSESMLMANLPVLLINLFDSLSYATLAMIRGGFREIEAMLFASGEPIQEEDLKEKNVSDEDLRKKMDELNEKAKTDFN